MAKQSTLRWSAVAILPGSVCCEAARALRGQRFLSAAAPRFPLQGCSTPQNCHCVYRKYPDRRTGPRRGEEQSGMRRVAHSGPERRVSRGRRSTDV